MAQTLFYQHTQINPMPEVMLIPTYQAVYIAQQYEREQRNETKHCWTFDGFEI